MRQTASPWIQSKNLLQPYCYHLSFQVAEVHSSPGKHKITSMQVNLYPSQLQNNKADISSTEKPNPAWAVPLNQALNQYENQGQLFFANTSLLLFLFMKVRPVISLWTRTKLSSNCSLTHPKNPPKISWKEMKGISYSEGLLAAHKLLWNIRMYRWRRDHTVAHTWNI